ncbi:hypothetical protein [Acinetobacter guillouiae]|uniref:hypothetical protein n=1 Tax=Acinetobacter guillouiae TaxID=106649 RepID=UPI003AF44710
MNDRKISKGDIVKHDSINFELKALSVNGTWVTCEWADEDGFRSEKVIDINHLTLIKPSASILDAM